MPHTESLTAITHIRTIGIPVADQDRALEFYVGTLGFEKRIDAEFAPGRRWVEVAPPDAATSIALIGVPGSEAAGVETQIRLATPDAATYHQALRAQGVDVDAEIMRAPIPMFLFRDPDGNSLVIVEESAPG
ncbi:MAG: VOC family protein [Chloroflexota bacterium]